ncbi:MAG: GMC oxidoreductase [Planctomycetota bacterium]
MPPINRRKAIGGIAASTVIADSLMAETKRQQARRNSRAQTCCPGDVRLASRLQQLQEMFNEFQRDQPKKRRMLAAFAQAYMNSLWGNETPTDDPYAVADNIQEFLSSLPPIFQEGLDFGLAWINLRSRLLTKRWFTELSIQERRQLLSQGEDETPFPLISWDNRFVIHTITESLAMVTRLVTNSRNPARLHINGMWGEAAKRLDTLADDPMLKKPAYPHWNDDADEFDVVIVGSGAGGAVVASEVLQAGFSCLIIESGDWVHPTQYVQKGFENGKEVAYPPKTEEVLRNTYMNNGLNPLGKLLDFGLGKNEKPDEVAEVDSEVAEQGDQISPVGRSIPELLADLLPTRDENGALRDNPGIRIPPFKSRPKLVNLVQANVVGGGPYINNAIHLPIKPKPYKDWGENQPIVNGERVPYEKLKSKMDAIEDKLGVSAKPSEICTGDDAELFRKGVLAWAQLHAPDVEPESLPVSIDDPTEENNCIGSGSDNWIDPHGRHIGGLHPWRANKPNSYFMDIVKNCSDTGKNCVAYKTKAVRFEVEIDPVGEGRKVTHLIVEDGHGTRVRRRKIRAKKFVLAAGAVASTNILHASPYLQRTPGLGSGFTGNVGSPLMAVFGKPVRKEDSERPLPGIAQCVMVQEDEQGQRPLLENWFGLPGMVALSASGWFGENAKVMNKFRHLITCGIVIPTKVRKKNKISANGRAVLDLSETEFELYMKGLKLVAEIFFAAAEAEGDTVELIFPTKGAILDEKTGKPLKVTDPKTLKYAVQYIEKRGVPFLNIICTHPQGGNPLGKVVDNSSFKVMNTENLFIADASVFPGPCKINPQLTLKALAHYAADQVIADLSGSKTPLVDPLASKGG